MLVVCLPSALLVCLSDWTEAGDEDLALEPSLLDGDVECEGLPPEDTAPTYSDRVERLVDRGPRTTVIVALAIAPDGAQRVGGVNLGLDVQRRLWVGVALPEHLDCTDSRRVAAPVLVNCGIGQAPLIEPTLTGQR